MSVEAPVKKFTIKDYKSDLHNDWCPGCVAPSTRIVTPDGFREIAQIRVGDEVMGHDGAFHRVAQVFSHDHDAPMQRLTIRFLGEVILTPDHPVYVGRRTGPNAFTLEWREARELRTNDVIAYPSARPDRQRAVHLTTSDLTAILTARPVTEADHWHYSMLQVEANEVIDYSGPVHNLEVEDANSYVTDVATLHNCGDFGILTGIQMALAQLNLDPDRVAVFSGIGCSGKTPHYIKAYGFHTLHGRVLPVATGARLVNSGVTVIALGGDGDGYGIGSGYFVNSGRRNVDMPYLVHNNNVYGLTKGQASPTLSKGKKTKSMPEQAIQDGINPIAMAVAAGYTFIARGYALEPKHLSGIIAKSIEHKGAALVDVLQTCPTYNDLYTKEWYEGADLPEKRSRLYKLEEAGFDPVVHDVTDEQEIVAKKAAAVVKSYEKEPIPIGIYYQAELPTYEDALRQRIPTLAEKPLIDVDTFDRDITPLLEAMR